MSCYHPLLLYRSKTVGESGKRAVSFSPNDSYSDLTVQVPCGQCIGCRLERSRQWAVRCMFESQLHESNSFITLTFDDKHLDPMGSLRKDDFTLFMKRFRKSIEPHKVRFFHCGEYGERTSRPHHHAIIFGWHFPDRELLKVENGFNYYTSPKLEKLWGMGNVIIADVTFETCAYVAGYCLKKLSNPSGDSVEAEQARQKFIEHYKGRLPEYVTMSRRPGIGHDWLERFFSDVYPQDQVVVRDGVICRPPKYYDKILETHYPEMYRALKKARLQAVDSENNSLERLVVREKVARGKLKLKGKKL